MKPLPYHQKSSANSNADATLAGRLWYQYFTTEAWPSGMAMTPVTRLKVALLACAHSRALRANLLEWRLAHSSLLIMAVSMPGDGGYEPDARLVQMLPRACMIVSSAWLNTLILEDIAMPMIFHTAQIPRAKMVI